MTSKAKLYTDKDLDLERVLEIRVVDLRGRNKEKQKSFSILVKRETKNNEYPTAEEMRNFLEIKAKEMGKE